MGKKRSHWIWARIFVICFLPTTYYILPTSSLAQISFEKAFGDTADNLGRSVQQTLDGGYIIAGQTKFFNADSTDVYIVKTDSLGDTLWTKIYGNTADDQGYSVQETQDGGYIITGYTYSFGAGLSDVYLIKTDSLGDSLWTRTYGGTGFDQGVSVQETQDGGYIIAGGTSSGPGWNVYLIKTASSGDTLWTKTYGGTGFDIGWSVQETQDGGYIIGGWTDSFGAGSNDIYLVKTDSMGETLWTRAYGGTASEIGLSVQETQDGGYVIAGYTESFGAGLSDVYLIKTDSSGDTLWTRTYGGVWYDYGYSVQETQDGGYIIAGTSISFSGGSYFDAYLIKTDSSGDTLWTKVYGGMFDERGFSVKQTSDGGYIIAGETESYGAGGLDVYLIKTAGDGGVGVEEENTKLKMKNEKFELLQSYPNPLYHSTTIRYILPAISIQQSAFSRQGKIPVHLAIYDITGGLVETLVDEPKKIGVYQVQWDGKDQASGVYFYRLQSGDFTSTKKMILLR